MELSAKSDFPPLLAQLCEMLLKLDCPPWAQKIIVLPPPIKERNTETESGFKIEKYTFPTYTVSST